MNDYRLESPPILRDFLSYHETIKAHSQKTVDEYFLDLRNFFRYLKQSRDPSLRGLPLNEISIMDVDLDFVKKVTLTDIYAYMTYLSRDRAQHQNSDVSDYGLNAASRARKIATIRSFYNYLVNKAHLLDTNPCKDLDSPKIKKSLPKYLTLDESVQLLQSVDGQNRERDYCILTIFLNCGLRISELCGLDLQDIQDDALRVLGKGNKVRIVYLNDACKDALKRYLAVRRPISGRDHNALFLSSRNERISRSSVSAASLPASVKLGRMLESCGVVLSQMNSSSSTPSTAMSFGTQSLAAEHACSTSIAMLSSAAMIAAGFRRRFSHFAMLPIRSALPPAGGSENVMQTALCR